MKRILAALFLTLAAGAAHAQTFVFSYVGAGVSGSGTLTTTLLAPGQYAVIGGTDVATGGGVNGTLTLLVNSASPNEAYSPSGYFLYDDLLFPNGDPLVSNGGLLFGNGAGGEVNLYSNGPDDYVYYDNTGYNVPITFDPSMVPEPAAFAIFIPGLAGLVHIRRRRRSGSDALQASRYPEAMKA
jgi:hypothetical protein